MLWPNEAREPVTTYSIAATDTDALPLDLEPGRGVYDAARAGALAGVPKSTLHYWARTGLYRPSISPGPRVRLWSWADLLALRSIDWLRRKERSGDSDDRAGVPRVAMQKIRQAMVQLTEQGVSRERLTEVLAATSAGNLYLHGAEGLTVRAAPGQQSVIPDLLVFVRPYAGAPDLLRPRPLLRIIPGKLHGEPHVVDTRIASATLDALQAAGYTTEQIRRMYPDVSQEALDQALDLERSLRTVATRAA